LINKLSLGSVQFGLKYGIASRRESAVPKNEVLEIPTYAREKGLENIDTAYVYGEAESIIGEFLAANGPCFKIVSKLPAFEVYRPGMARDHCFQSLKRLRQDTIYGYLVRGADDIVKREGLWQEMRYLKEEGFLNKIGVSIYKTDDLEVLIHQNIIPDILQVPYSILDQRFEKYFRLMKDRGAEIHARSIFLQGLFFAEDRYFDGPFAEVKERMYEIRRIARQTGISVSGLCLKFALREPGLDKVIIGVDSLEQLKENIDAFSGAALSESQYETLKGLKCDNENIILPTHWR